MADVQIRPYVSPTCVLLALDWPEGADRSDFLGFAIRRTPGFWGQQESWLPNILSFEGPIQKDKDPSSSKNPIQKFLWWDARIDDPDRGKTFLYEAFPVVGLPTDPALLKRDGGKVKIRIPFPIHKKIGTYFNRAVVSSQAFAKKFGGDLEGERLTKALKWLANGLEEVIPEFLKEGLQIDGAIYHLTDKYWVIPALEGLPGKASLVYNRTKKDTQSDEAIQQLEETKRGDFEGFPRTRASIMHNKFLVKSRSGKGKAVLMGSANFTTGGLATQANLIHTFDSEELARLYLERKRLLQDDPKIAETAQEAGWSKPVQVGDAKVRVFFSPEPKGERESIDTVVRAIQKAKRSVIFCLFMPTDKELRDACFGAGDKGLMMFGLINRIGKRLSNEEPENAADEAKVEIYHRSQRKRDVFSHSAYAGSDRPRGFWWEEAELPGDRSQWPVWIHHKFVLIDAEAENSTIFSGSANMSKNALWRNDENLLEIKGSKHLASIYLTEFLRLYEHYRARSAWNRWEKKKEEDKTYRLQPDSRWARKHFTKGTPEFKSRVSMVRG